MHVEGYPGVPVFVWLMHLGQGVNIALSVKWVLVHEAIAHDCIPTSENKHSHDKY